MSKEMAETKMPAAEAAVAIADERNSYELAFHVLPTVAEGEVSNVFDSIKAFITKKGAEIFDEEAPERFDLAYEIVKHIEGKNRKFSSAYFGWVRFRVSAEAIEAIAEEIDGNPSILRHMVIKLTKAEEANPFRFHEALASQKVVTNIEEPAATVEEVVEGDEVATEDAEVDESTSKDEA